MAGDRSTGKGTAIGPYSVVRELGRGAMGVVYLAEHGELGHRHAVKVLNPSLLEDKTALRRFELEMENLARVDGHPGIVRVHSAGRTAEGSPWFAMEFVEGRTLTQAVKDGLPRERALDAALQVARALGHAHRLGLLHRDVKPDNILIGDDGQARLTDFGLARVALTNERLTRTSELLGTPFYMAPEQANPQAGKVGPWTDVYAAGAVMYELLCGRPPHDGLTTIEVCTKLLNDPIVPPRQHDATVHPAVDAVVLRALGRRPQDRFPSGAALADALEAALKEASAPPPAPRPRALVVVLALLAVASVALAIGAVLTVTARREAELERASAMRREVAGLEALLRRGKAQEVLEKVALLGEGREAAPRSAELAAAWAAFDQVAERARGARDDGAFAVRLRSAKAALDLGRTAEAREALADGDLERDFPERAVILALTGDPEAALAGAAALPPAQRARVAAWAGDRAATVAALAEVTPPARAHVLARELEAFAPGVLAATPFTPAPRQDEEDSWGRAARAHAALAFGLPGLAGLDGGSSGGRDAEDDVADARLGLATARARAAIVRAEARGAGSRLADVLRGGGLDPFERAEALAALLEAGAGDEVPTTFEGGAPAEALRMAPGHPGIARALWRRQVVAGGLSAPGGSPVRLPAVASLLDRARDAARARGAGAGLQALGPAAPPAPASRDARSFILAERALCARGVDGPGGLLLARAVDLAFAADAGPDPGAADAALGGLEQATRLRPESALAALAAARAALVVHDVERALGSSGRALDLAPGDPLALIVRARALRAQVEEHREDVLLSPTVLDAPDPEPRVVVDDRSGLGLRADSARSTGRTDPALDQQAAAALAPVVVAWEAALAAAVGSDAPAGPCGPLERAARLGLAAARGERARRLLRGGAEMDAARPLLDQAREALTPLLGRCDPGAVADARAALGSALDGEREEQVRAAEDALAAALREAPPGAREALLLGAALRIDGDGQAWSLAHLALAGDLPARALLETGAALDEREPAPRRRRLERAAALCPLPQPRLALLAEGGFERSPAGLEALARIALDAPEWSPLVVWLLAVIDPGDGGARTSEALDQRLPLDAPGADPVLRPMARALGRFAVPFAADPARPGGMSQRLRARVVDVSRALAADPDAIAPRALRAIALLQLGQVIGRREDGQRTAAHDGLLDDARHDLRVARAARPDAPALALLEVLPAVSRDELDPAASRALARGYTPESVARLRAAQGLASGESHTEAVVQALRAALDRGERTPSAHARELAAGGRTALALTLLGVECDRASDALALDAPGPDLEALATALGEGEALAGQDRALGWALAARRDLVRHQAQRRPGAGVVPEVRAMTLRAAAESALRWGVRARRAGDPPALVAQHLPAVPLRLPTTPAVTSAGREMLALGQPSDGARAAAWSRLVAPGAALDALARAVEALAQDGRGTRPSIDGPMDPGDRALARLVLVQDGAAQARAATEALAQRRWGDLALALDRALAFDPEGAPARTGARLVRAVRRLAPRDNPQHRGRALRAAWRLADEALSHAGAASALRGERADVLLDLVASNAATDPREQARALEVARGDAEASRPVASDAPEAAVAAWWRLVRSAALDGQAGKARDAALALKAALPPGGREAFAREVEVDPALPRVRALPEVEQVLRDLGLTTY